MHPTDRSVSILILTLEEVKSDALILSGVPGEEDLRRDRTRVKHDAQWLLGVTAGEFNRRGYDATSMSQVAPAAGITKSTTYHHFESRELLLRGAVERALDALFAVLEQEPSRTGRAGERLP